METGLIYKKMAQVLADIPNIGKNKNNKMGGYSFRGIDDLYDAVNSVLAKHGVFVLPKVLSHTPNQRPSSKGGILYTVTVLVEFKFCAEDGSSVECIMAGEAFDSGDKATSKAMSMAMKYAFFQVFCIAVNEIDDGDKNTYDTRTPHAQSTANGSDLAKQRLVSALMDKYNNDQIKALEWTASVLNRNVSTFEELTAQDIEVLRAGWNTAPQENKEKSGGF